MCSPCQQGEHGHRDTQEERAFDPFQQDQLLDNLRCLSKDEVSRSFQAVGHSFEDSLDVFFVHFLFLFTVLNLVSRRSRNRTCTLVLLAWLPLPLGYPPIVVGFPHRVT